MMDRNEYIYDEVLESMSEDDELNARIEAFRQIKNPDRIQKARLQGLLLEQKARQRTAAPDQKAAHAANVQRKPLNFIHVDEITGFEQNSSPIHPAEKSAETVETVHVDTPAEMTSLDQDLPVQQPVSDHVADPPQETETILMQDDPDQPALEVLENGASVPEFAMHEAGPEQESLSAMARSLLKQAATPLDSKPDVSEASSLDVPSFFHAAQPSLYDEAQLEQIARSAMEPEKQGAPVFSGFARTANFSGGSGSGQSEELDTEELSVNQEPESDAVFEPLDEILPDPASRFASRSDLGSISPSFSSDTRMPETRWHLFGGRRSEPSLKHVYVDPDTGQSWAEDGAEPATENLHSEAVYAAPKPEAEAVQPEYMLENYEETLPVKSGSHIVRKVLTWLAVILLAAGVGFGGWFALEYMAPENVAYREFFKQAETFAKNYDPSSAESMDTLASLEEQYDALNSEQQDQVNTMFMNSTGKDFQQMVEQIKVAQRKQELETQIAQLAAEVDGYNDQIAQTSANLKEAQNQYDSAQKSADKAKKDADKAAAKVETTSQQIAKTQQSIDDYNADIAALQQEIAELEGTSDLEDDENDDKPHGSHDIFGDFKLSMKKRSLTQKQNSLAAAQQSLDSLQSELAQYQAESQEAADAYSQQQSLADQLGSALNEMQSKYDTLNQSLQQAQGSLDQAQQEMDSLQV